jgi:hypothetical protein
MIFHHDWHLIHLQVVICGRFPCGTHAPKLLTFRLVVSAQDLGKRSNWES